MLERDQIIEAGDYRPEPGMNHTNFAGDNTHSAGSDGDLTGLLDENRRQKILLQTIFDTIPGGIAVLAGPDLTFQYVNRSYRELLPDPEIDPIGRPYAEVWPSGEVDHSRQIIQEVLSSNQPYHMERYPRRSLEGATRYYSLHLQPLPWNSEAAVLMVLWDTTELEEAQHDAQTVIAHAHRQAEQLNAIFASMNDVVIIYDAEGIPRQANPAALLSCGFNPVGYSQEMFIKRLSIRHTDGRSVRVEEFPASRALRGERVRAERLYLTNPEGKEFYIQVSASPIFIEGKVSGLVMVWHDVSIRERLLVELEIEQVRLQAIIENAPEAIVVVDRESRIVLANPTAEHLYARPLPYGQDYTSQAEIEPTRLDGTPIPPRELPLTRSALDGQTLTDYEMIIQWPDGQKRYLKVNSAPIRDRQGALNGAVATFLDITEQKRTAVENASLYTAIEQRARELNALHTATSVLLSTLDLETLLGQIIDSAVSAIPSAEKGDLHLFARETSDLQMRANLGYSDLRLKRFSLQRSQGYPRQAVIERRPLLIHDSLEQPPEGKTQDIAYTKEFRSAIVAPLIYNDQVLGALSLDSSRPGAFDETDLRLLVSFATTTTMAIQNATLHAEVQRQAITDPLTNLYNRRGFMELGRREIERSRRFGRPLSAIMVDIDNFKQVNDAYTHAVGDQVLQFLATLLGSRLREVDILGRYGGEEFIVLLPETDLFTASNVAERLRKTVAETPTQSTHGPVSITISIGVTKLNKDTQDLAKLLNQADLAMYAAKQGGRDRVEVL